MSVSNWEADDDEGVNPPPTVGFMDASGVSIMPGWVRVGEKTPGFSEEVVQGVPV